MNYRTQMRLEQELDRRRRLNEFADNIRAGGKAYKILSACAITGVFAAFGLLVFAITGFFHLDAILVGLIVSVITASLGIITILPWVRRIEKGELKKMSIVFISLIGVCILLWFVSVWTVVILFKTQSESIGALVFVFNLIKATIVISAQLIVSSTIANVILKYKTTFIPFQIVTYLSYIFIDVYLCILLFSLVVTNETVYVSDAIGVLGNRYMITFLILSFVYSAVSSGIMKSIETRKTKRVVNGVSETTENALTENEEQEEAKQEAPKQPKSAAERLENLKVMHENGLITDAEYDAKRADILKDM
ncbi:MAG: SHOCT domain-containing protein [bacterium]|nr:SHOCT domain-containing protein [bacterium]